MNIITRIKVFACIMLFAPQLHSQSATASGTFAPKVRTCATPAPPPEWDAWFNGLVKASEQVSPAMKKQATSYTIPVVVHVIHNGEAPGVSPNISKAQINSQIAALNDDFAGSGYNSANIPNVFADDKANCNIKFMMAQLDPQGKPLKEAGIHRVDWHDLGIPRGPNSIGSATPFQKFFDDSIKPLTIWNPLYYLNIWVSDVAPTNDLLGYASFPAGTSLAAESILGAGLGGVANDGVWIWEKAFGTTGNLFPPYNKGRTATHELGHWLGVRHIWGDESCGNDYCDDTPKQQTSNLNCPTYPKTSCSNEPGGEMFMNFMDYCPDQCLSMFTWDQMSRMHIAMQSGTFRKQLSASSLTLCNLPLEEPIVAFTLPDSSCANAPFEIANESGGMPDPFYSWQMDPPAGYMVFPSDYGDEPVFVFTSPGIYKLTLTATNDVGTKTITKQFGVDDCGIPAGLAKNQGFSSLSLSPNPATGLVNITGDLARGVDVNIEVQNAMGAIVFKGAYPAQSIAFDVSALPAGVYFTNIQQGPRKSVKKLVISR